MNAKWLYDKVSAKASKMTTRSYSTSFSLGIRFLNRRLRDPIYAIYGFVRLADEIVDSFSDYNQTYLLHQFRMSTEEAMCMKISINPILNSFQHVVHRYQIDWELIDTFLQSMEMDLHKTMYERDEYDRYILGSAEVVGLMCLRVFVEGDDALYQKLKPHAMSLGSAFQKINFLRDAQADFTGLGRSYFPGVDMESFSAADKCIIEEDIKKDLEHALEGIRQLPVSARKGVYLAYVYYHRLFEKLRSMPAGEVLKARVRIDNGKKFGLMVESLLRHQFNVL